MDRYYHGSSQVGSRVVEGEAVPARTPEGGLLLLNPAASRIRVEADGTRSGAGRGKKTGRRGYGTLS